MEVIKKSGRVYKYKTIYLNPERQESFKQLQALGLVNVDLITFTHNAYDNAVNSLLGGGSCADSPRNPAQDKNPSDSDDDGEEQVLDGGVYYEN